MPSPARAFLFFGLANLGFVLFLSLSGFPKQWELESWNSFNRIKADVVRSGSLTLDAEKFAAQLPELRSPTSDPADAIVFAAHRSTSETIRGVSTKLWLCLALNSGAGLIGWLVFRRSPTKQTSLGDAKSSALVDQGE